MIIDNKHLILALLKNVICKGELSQIEKNAVYNASLSDLFVLSAKHGVAHIICVALQQLNAFKQEDETQKYFEYAKNTAIFGFARMDYELEQISKLFENHKIQFIPLKGAVIRKYYSEQWLRTSCDIDVLIHKNDLENATKYLINEYGYEKKKLNGSHEISFTSKTGIHLELHYELIEADYAVNAPNVLKNIWNYAIASDSSDYKYDLTDEMFFFYHIAHTVKHLEFGGCGIRPFLDLWVLEHNISHSDVQRNLLLEKGGLLTFANAARALSRVWFDNETPNKIIYQMQEYIFDSGLYGNTNNLVANQQKKMGGKIKYSLYKIFSPYSVIKFHYPILEKHKWLLPILEVRRWGKLLFCGGLKRSINTIKTNAAMSPEQVNKIAILLKNVGLNDNYKSIKKQQK